MDIFKLLSRSTSLSRKPVSSQKFPSSGQSANPQLFGREVDQSAESTLTAAIGNEASVLGKRKRNVHARDSVPKELDFFGHKEAAKPAPGSTIDKSLLRKSNGDNYGEIESDIIQQDMSEEQRRTILKSHKIKVIVLVEGEAAAELGLSKKTSKDNKSKNRTENGGLGSQKRQLYPEPLQSFSQLRSRHSISRRLAENLEMQGYKLPTEVQLAAIPLLMDKQALGARGQPIPNGAHLLSVAPTGSGKTLAFLIPTIDALLREKSLRGESGVQAVVLAPTRELAHQIVNEGKKLLQNTGIRITLLRKGMRLSNESSSEGLRSEDESGSESDGKAQASVVKAHIIVSTPMILANCLSKGDKQRNSLAAIRHLILDEADVLLDPLFREQVESIWNSCTNSELRVSLWSATMSSSIEDFALQQLAKPDHQNRKPVIRLVVGLKDTAIPTLTHTMTYTGTEAGKLLALRQLLHPTAPNTDDKGRKALRPPFLVFTQTIERAKALQAELKYDIPPEAGGSARMAALHSEMSEKAREKVMADFRKGEIWVIITTDLLARGVDFRGLNGVVNYDVPTSAATYVHRVGRTGRAGREGGVAVTFYTKEDIPYVKPIANVIAASEKLRAKEGGKNESSEIQKWLLDALPMPTKQERKELKAKGVAARRKGEKTAMISTKGGLQRPRYAKSREVKGAGKGANAQKLGSRPSESSDDFAGFSD